MVFAEKIQGGYRVWERAKKELGRFLHLLQILFFDFISFIVVLVFLHFGEWAIKEFVHSPQQQETFQLVHYIMTTITWILLFLLMVGHIVAEGVRAVRDAGK